MLWADIAGDDAAKAYRALWALVAVPDQALPLVRNTLRPVPAVTEDRLKKLIADLDDDDFAVREKATDELAKVGGAADSLLRRTLEGKPSAEQRQRLQRLLEQVRSVGTTTDGLRQVRALELLECVGTEEAKALLKELAKGAPGAALTEQAKVALKRFER
jgi:HEAT repeat protein